MNFQPMFSGSSYPIRLLYDQRKQTGNGKSKMAALNFKNVYVWLLCNVSGNLQIAEH